jgi:hypothetical protein
MAQRKERYTMKKEAESVSEILVPIYHTVNGHIPEDGNIHIHRREQRVCDVTFTWRIEME